MSDLDALIVSFGIDSASDRVASVDTPEGWLAAANGRSVWQLWGKARPTGACPAHPLLCHVVDVAAVAALMLTRTIAPALGRALLSLHPDGEERALRLLLFVIALHDLGKATPAFQAKAPWAGRLLPGCGFDLNAPDDARHHGDVGLRFVRDAVTSSGVEVDTALRLARAVTAHHGEFPTNVSLSKRPSSKERGELPAWVAARAGITDELRKLFGVELAPAFEVEHSYVALLAGLTSVADWIGSMDDVFVYEPPQSSLPAYWPRALERARVALGRAWMRDSTVSSARSFIELFPQYSPWPLHIAADGLAARLDEPVLVVVEAPMGEGKTEASLLLAEAAASRLGQQGLYIGLPTQATANQMLGRVQTFLRRAHAGEGSNLVLAHGEAGLNERFQKLRGVYDGDERRGDVRAESWFLSKKRTLLAAHAVGTIDQALLAVLRTAHAFVRLYGLAGKTVVLDEVHAYDTYTSTLLERLVEWLAATGSTVVLLSATLPPARRAALVRAYRKGAGGTEVGNEAPAADYPRITLASRKRVHAESFAPRGKSVSIAIEQRTDVEDFEALARAVIASVADGGCAGWICNTVARAQKACEAVRRLAPNVPRLLIHARLLPEERQDREQKLERWLGPEREGTVRPRCCIVIGTQVLEQSLDVDFDRLFTDVAPIDLVLQRAGRLHRHVRSNRVSGHAPPRLVVVRPAGAWESVDLDNVAIVYPEVLVRATLRVLSVREAISLPDDIERLVAEVYDDSGILADAEGPLFKAAIEHRGTTIAERQNAEGRLMPRPTVEDDPFGDLRVVFDDDEDPALNQQLRAVTRLGDPSVDIVCLVERDGVLYADEKGRWPIDLDTAPDHSTVQRLVRRAIGVSRRGLVAELLRDASYQPKAWSTVALLRYRRAVHFVDGVAVVGTTRLTLDPELGLVIEHA